MPYSLPQFPDLSHVGIVEFPNTTQPYSRPKGRFVLGFSATALIASVIAASATPPHLLDLFVFFTSFFSLVLIGCSVFYSVALFSWRAFRLRRIVFQPRLLASSISLDADTKLVVDLQNPLPWTLTIDLVACEHTLHLRIDDGHAYPIRLAPKTAVQLSFAVHAKSLGPAGIVGFCVAIGDGHDMFRGEAHIETNLDLDVIPPEIFHPAKKIRLLMRSIDDRNSTRQLAAVPEAPSDAEHFERKPYAPGDPIRYVDWRALARTRELYVYKPTLSHLPHAVLLVDARSFIGKTTAPSDNIFAGVMAFVDQTAHDFASYAIYVDDPREPSPPPIAQSADAPSAHRALCAALIKALAFRLPNVPATPQALGSTPFAHALARDFLLYHQVDFVRGNSADLDSLCLWRHLETHRHDASASPMPDFATAIRSVASDRRNWPDIPRQIPPIDLAKTIAAIPQTLPADARFFWFSEFNVGIRFPIDSPVAQLHNASPTAIVCVRANDTPTAIARQNARKLQSAGFNVLTGTIEWPCPHRHSR